MSNNKKFSNVADGLFSVSENVEIENNSTKKSKKIDSKNKKIGRPVSKDIKAGEQTMQTSIYLTEDTKMQIDIFAIKNKMDRSEAIRYLIRKYTNADTGL